VIAEIVIADILLGKFLAEDGASQGDAVFGTK
jgi:hypothetical protein